MPSSTGMVTSMNKSKINLPLLLFYLLLMTIPITKLLAIKMPGMTTTLNLQNILLGIVITSCYKFRKNFFSKMHLFFITFIVWSLPVVILHELDWLGIVKFLRIVKGIIIFGLTYHILSSFRDVELIKRSLMVLAMVAIGIFLFAMFQVLTYYIWGIEWPYLSTHDPFGNKLLIPKVSAIFSGHRKPGLIGGLFFPYFLLEFLIYKKKSSLVWLVILLFGITVSYSRLGFLAILITIIASGMIYIVSGKKVRLLLISGITLLGAIPIIGILLYKFNPVSTQRYLNLWWLDIKYFLDSPIYGHGFAYFIRTTGGSVPHSGIFDILIGTGVVGLIFYFTPLLDIAKGIFKSWLSLPQQKTKRFLLLVFSCQILIIFFAFLIKEIHYLLLTYVIFGLAATFISLQNSLQSKQL